MYKNHVNNILFERSHCLDNVYTTVVIIGIIVSIMIWDDVRPHRIILFLI